MKIATFNINNLKKRLANLLDWLAESSPDVVCLQELKCEQGAFLVDALRQVGELLPVSGAHHLVV